MLNVTEGWDARSSSFHVVPNVCVNLTHFLRTASVCHFYLRGGGGIWHLTKFLWSSCCKSFRLEYSLWNLMKPLKNQDGYWWDRIQKYLGAWGSVSFSVLCVGSKSHSGCDSSCKLNLQPRYLICASAQDPKLRGAFLGQLWGCVFSHWSGVLCSASWSSHCEIKSWRFLLILRVGWSPKKPTQIPWKAMYPFRANFWLYSYRHLTT